jgi:hypothetical protein
LKVLSVPDRLFWQEEGLLIDQTLLLKILRCLKYLRCIRVMRIESAHWLLTRQRFILNVGCGRPWLLSACAIKALQ